MAKSSSGLASLQESRRNSRSAGQQAAAKDREYRDEYGDDYRDRDDYTGGSARLVRFQQSEDPEKFLRDMSGGTGSSGEDGYQRLLEETGLNRAPTTLREEDFDRFVKMSGATVMYRGWRGKEDYDRFLQSGRFQSDASNTGGGYQVVRDIGAARSLPGSGNTVTRMVLNPDARVISYSRVARAVQSGGSRLSNAQMALKMGYNVIRMGDGRYVGLTSDAFIISRKSVKY